MYKATDLSSVSGWKMAPWPFVPCPDGLGVTCISWCSSPFLKPLLVVGTMSGLVQVLPASGKFARCCDAGVLSPENRDKFFAKNRTRVLQPQEAF